MMSILELQTLLAKVRVMNNLADRDSKLDLITTGAKGVLEYILGIDTEDSRGFAGLLEELDNRIPPYQNN